MLAHRQISIRVGIFATIVAVVGLLAAALIAYNYRSNADIALGAADALMQQVGDKVAERTRNLVRPLASASEFLTSLPEIGAKANFLSHPLQPLMIELLEAHPQISSIYLGFEDGEFFRVLSLRDSSVAVGLGGPETARFATWLIFHGDDGRRREAWKFLNPDRQIVGSRVGPAVSYDPRQRPWYRQAIESEHAVWTEPYAYAQPREVGLTIARRFDAAVPGVLGVDLTLASLSTFLHQQQLAEQASILMFRRDGSVLAYSNPATLVREQGEGVGSRLRLARVQ
jgi:adenylate cyclase